jgi:tetratricopeptide (TPR) repeat protein
MPAFINNQGNFMHTEIITYFDALSADEILQDPAGKWSDSHLLDVLAHFNEQNDIERSTAVLQLILSSPDHNSEMVDYSELYSDLIHTYIHAGNFAAAAYWTIAGITYDAQHYIDSPDPRNYQRLLAEIYLRQGDVDTGLQLITRLLQSNPADLWTYDALAHTLPSIGLSKLALTALERALELTAENDPEQLADQLQKAYDEISETGATAVSPPPAIHPHILAQFHHALTLPPEDDPPFYHSPVADLLAKGETLDPNLQSALETQGSLLVPELILLAFDEEYWETAVNRHVTSLLRHIHATQPALDAIDRWLAQTTDENWTQLLSEHIGKIGGFTTVELQTIAADTGLEPFIRQTAALELGERLPETGVQRDNNIAFFRALLTRQEAYEASEELFLALLITAITNTGAKELYPEIKQVFDEDRLDPTITDLRLIHQKWDLPPLPPPEIRDDGLYLMLICTKCQRTRQHFVQHVTIDLTTLYTESKGQRAPYDPHIMDRPIICPKCGAVDQYQTDAITNMRLTIGGNFENILAIMTGKEPTNVSPSPNVSQVRPQAFGRDMHPLVALDKYKQIALRNPKQAEPHWRMGNILRMIWRDEQAREAYQRSLELDPDEIYAIYSLATTEHDLGNFEEAQALYQDTMRRISPLAMLQDEELLGLSMSAASGLKALKRGQPSPYSQDFRQPQTEQEPKKLSRKEKQQQKKINKRR